ncbi:hypothetical protein BDN67DRAFT_1015839 [Paxillus ammoniavirescens]|nr:hypothetical protein BDN67DRAFT_1015839 [Paxillus ammoniavirescens]
MADDQDHLVVNSDPSTDSDCRSQLDALKLKLITADPIYPPLASLPLSLPYLATMSSFTPHIIPRVGISIHGGPIGAHHNTVFHASIPLLGFPSPTSFAPLGLTLQHGAPSECRRKILHKTVPGQGPYLLAISHVPLHVADMPGQPGQGLDWLMFFAGCSLYHAGPLYFLPSALTFMEDWTLYQIH